MSILDTFKKDGRSKGTKRDEKKSKQIRESKVKEDKGKKENPKSKKSVARIFSSAYRVVINPIISEKATFLSSENKYVFEVYKDADKKQVKQAIMDVYGVRPLKVNIINVLGKSRRYGKYTGRTKNRKKAIVTLEQGQSIQVYDGV